LKTLDHSVILRKSNLIGESTFNLIDILRQHNGKLSNVELHVDLRNDGNKVGTLVVRLDGLRVDMGATSSTPGTGSSVNLSTTNPPATAAGERPGSGLGSSVAPSNGVPGSSSGCNGISNSTQALPTVPNGSHIEGTLPPTPTSSANAVNGNGELPDSSVRVFMKF
jgi:hypothetical protein